MYLNFIATAIGILFSISILFTPADLVFKTVFAFGFGTPMPLIFYLNYSSGKKYMLKRGHSEACSQKIAQMYALRANLWVPLRVVDSDSKPQ